MTDDCAFCRIAAGSAPARIVAAYADAVAFLPLNPATAGHTLVVPRRHIAGVTDLDAATAHALADAVLDVARLIDSALHPEGFNVVQSTGAAATQTVFHLHVHVVPRMRGDGLPSPWPPSRAWPADTLDAIAARLRAAAGPGHHNAATTT